MNKFCILFNPLLVIGVVGVFLCGLTLGQKYWNKDEKGHIFDNPGTTRLLLFLLAVALIFTIVFILYLFGVISKCLPIGIYQGFYHPLINYFSGML